MANQRSMLPKFRPATLGGSQRPQIRPVKPTAPPPPPTPPRRHSSGIRNPDDVQPATTNFQGQQPAPTQAGMMAAARARIHEMARELPADNRFGGAPPRFEDETQGRIEPHDYAQAHAYQPQHGQPQDAYDALPSLGHDAHDSNDYQQHTELRPAYDEVLQRHEARVEPQRATPQRVERNDYRNNERHDDYRDIPRDDLRDPPRERNEYRSDRPVPQDDSSGKYERGSSRGARNGSDARDPYAQQPQSYNSNSYDAAAYEANYPKAPRQEPSYMGRGPSEERRGGSSRSSAPRSDEYARDEYRREDPRRDERNNSYRDDRNSYRRDEPRRDEPRRDRDDRRSSYQPPRDETRAEGTGNRREREGGGYDGDPQIPGPARVPNIPDGFVVGVQPLRTSGTPSMSPQAVIAPIPAITPARGVPQGIVQAYPAQSTMGATPNAMMMPNQSYGGGQSFGQMGMPIMQPVMPQMMPQMAPVMPSMVPVGHTMGGMSVRPHTSMGRPGHMAQPTEFEEARQGSKIGRFAWFVFGAAFGIFFAFFATGFGFGGSKAEEANTATFPPPAHIPTPTAQPVQAPVAPPPVVQVAPIAPPPVAPVAAPPGAIPSLAPQGPAGQTSPPGAIPSLAPQAQPNNGVITSPQQFAPVAPAAPAPPPVRPAAPAPRNDSVKVRPAAPPPVPRRGGGGGNSGGASSGSAADDILNAGLGGG